MLSRLLLLSLATVVNLPPSAKAVGERTRPPNETVTDMRLLAGRSVVPLPVTVIVMDSFGDPRLVGAIRRTVGPERSNLIVLKRSALQPELLVELAHAMRTSIVRSGATPARQISMYFMRTRHWRTPTPAESAWAQQILAQIGTAQTRSFGRLGARRAVDTHIP